MRFAPGSFAVVAPDWLLAHCDAEWTLRYGHRIEESRLPKSEIDRLAVAQLIGQDGWKVLTEVFDPLAPSWLRAIPAVQVLRQIWVQNYWMEDGHLRWREAENLPPATLALQLAVRDDKPTWAKSALPSGPVTSVHLTETCEQTLPHLITHVATTPARHPR